MSWQLMAAQREAEVIRTVEVEEKGEGGASSENFIFAIDTTTQAISVANTLQDVTFNTNVDIDGWTHTAGTAVFTVPITGEYDVIVRVNFERQTGGGGGGVATFQCICTLNGTEIQGSQNGADILQRGNNKNLISHFRFSGTATDTFKVRIASDKTNVDMKPGPTPGGAVTAISAALHITRVS